VADYWISRYAGWAPLDDGLIVTRGTWLATVKSPSARRLRDDLLAADGPVAESVETRSLLRELANRGILRTAGEQASSYQALLGAEVSCERPSSPVQRTRTGGEIAVLGRDELADVLADLLICELGDEPVAVRREASLGADIGPGCALAIAVAGAAGDVTDLTELNCRCHAEPTDWILVDIRANGPLFAGPLFVPARTACLECYWRRRAACTGRPATYEALLRRGRSGGGGSWQRHMAAGTACAMALGWVLAEHSWLPGAFFEIGITEGPLVRRHQALPIPGCPVCGEPGQEGGAGNVR
jgi:bacteriocin biosynthesis cyclodehydratase domain-containing protein